MFTVDVKVTGGQALKNLPQELKNFSGELLKRSSLSLSRRFPFALAEDILSKYGSRGSWALQNPYMWRVRTQKRGMNQYHITAGMSNPSAAEYADYLDNPSGPYPAEINKGALKSWMKKRGFLINRTNVNALAHNIKHFGHQTKAGQGYSQDATLRLLESYDEDFEFDVDSAFSKAFKG